MSTPPAISCVLASVNLAAFIACTWFKLSYITHILPQSNKLHKPQHELSAGRENRYGSRSRVSLKARRRGLWPSLQSQRSEHRTCESITCKAGNSFLQLAMLPLDLRCEIGGRGERGSEARQTRSVSATSLPIANDRLILVSAFSIVRRSENSSKPSFIILTSFRSFDTAMIRRTGLCGL